VSADNEMSLWAKAEVEAAISIGLVPERLQNNYQTNITREDFCVMIMALVSMRLDLPSEGVINDELHNPFKDTNAYAVIKANNLGIIMGKTENIFDPKGAITRQEAAAMLTRAANVMKMDTSADASFFADGARISGYAKGSVDFVYGTGIMHGLGNGIFDPTGYYTREQSFITALRLYNRLYGVESGQALATELEVRRIDSSAYGEPLIFINGYVFYRGDSGNIYRAPVYSPGQAELLFTLQGDNDYSKDGYAFFYPKAYKDIAILQQHTGSASMGNSSSTVILPDGNTEQFDYDVSAYESVGEYDIVLGYGSGVGIWSYFESRFKNEEFRSLGEDGYLYGLFSSSNESGTGLVAAPDLAVIGDYVFIIAQFTGGEVYSPPGIYKIELRTGKTERVIPETAFRFRVIGDSIFFKGEGDQIYKFVIEGGQVEKVADNIINNFPFPDGEEYFTTINGYSIAKVYLPETDKYQGIVIDKEGNIYKSATEDNIKFIAVYNGAIWDFV